jgi:hypothetical protein
MRVVCESLGNTEGNNTYWQSNVTAVYATAASKPWTFTMYTAVAGVRMTGENITIACAAYAGPATRTGTYTNEPNT